MLTLNLEYNSFDWINYVSYYEDLKKDNINTREKAWKHWITHGKKEGRQFFNLSEVNKVFANESNNIEKYNTQPKDNIIYDENFNWKKYISYYADLKNDNINTREKAYNHWIKYGKNEGRIYFDNNVDYDNFDWKTYVKFNTDLQYIKTKEKAWEHWYKHGKQENRTFFDLTKSEIYKNFEELEKITSKYEKESSIEVSKEEALPVLPKSIIKKDTTKISSKKITKKCKYDFENSFFINLACHYLSIKYNISVDYMHPELFKKFGVELFIGKNTYNSNFVITNDNFFSLINDSNNINAQIKENISLSDDLHCITKDFCLYVKKNYYDNNDNKNKIVNCNLFKERYVQNNDLFLYVSIEEYVDSNNFKNVKEYYIETIKKTAYDKIYISSKNINHEICKTIISSYSAIVCDKEVCEQIMFANTCKYLILSSDVTSLLIGMFNFFSKSIHYPIILGSKYNEIFDSFYWKGTEVAKIITQPKISPPIRTNQAPSPTDEWYDSPFIKPKTEQFELKKIKPILKVRFQEETPNDEPIQINFEKI
jgi:hypothetical protein